MVDREARAEIRALASGADHYLTMPLDPDVLAVRINASLRARSESAGKQSEGTLKVGNLEIDLDKKFAKKEGTIIPLTKTEWKVLLFLAQNADKLLTREELLSKVWGPAFIDDFQYLRVWVSRVREKIGDEEKRLIRNCV